MGLCCSSGAMGAGTLVASTAMVLLPTGELREYPHPPTAARALEDAVAAGEAAAGRWFLCDADRITFEDPVEALGGAEELRPGQIYFVIPARARRDGLSREEVATLAVRASAALFRKAAAANNATTGCGCVRRKSAGSVAPLLFARPEEEEEHAVAAFHKAAPCPRPKRPPMAVARLGGRKQQRFAPDLGAIPECEMVE